LAVKFLNNVEISAQEAVYITLHLPMRKASRQIMDDDSEEIYTTGLLKRCKHPPKLENLALVEWAEWYDNCS